MRAAVFTSAHTANGSRSYFCSKREGRSERPYEFSKGGVVTINEIHLDQMSAFDYDKLLWGERQIRSVANMTRQDACDFLKIAHDLHIRAQVTAFPLEDANEAVLAVKEETKYGSAVIVSLETQGSTLIVIFNRC